MNKALDTRIIPDGEYIHALNCRLGSSEGSDIGALENSKGNEQLTQIQYVDGTALSANARTIGSYEDGANETIYWFVHDPSFSAGATGKLDMIVSFNVQTNVLTYHVVSIDDGGGVNTTLNFNPLYVITGVNLVDSNSEGMLFWTDDYNAPRFINVLRTYPTPLFLLDQFSAESLLVIKKPPVTSPEILPVNTGSEENFMEERFICFGYRYRYADNEYSATSQFSEPAFNPGVFSFSVESFLNEGMVNTSNSVIITFNTGGPLVVGIDLLFKEAGNNTIKVIEKLDKATMGYADNVNQTYTFTNSKIFTVLPEAELLRLYDNVPRFAKAQTIMGNRLVYGNYVEGYDIIDKNGNDVRLDYVASLKSELINNTDVYDGTIDGNYILGSIETIADSILEIDLTSVAGDLVAGAVININMSVSNVKYVGNTPYPSTKTQDVDVSWSFVLPRDYATVYDLATSTEFTDAVGTAGTILPVWASIGPTSCDGSTFTDVYNCAMPNAQAGNPAPSPSPPVFKYRSGISGGGQPIAISASIGSNVIGFQIPAMHYVEDPATYTPVQYEVYEFCNIVSADATFVNISNVKSLHSNRGYEVGIVYMDEFNRASTALVSNNNTVHVPCSYSNQKNSIWVTIPITQIAPEWATRYKFVLKADRENYETIYANIFFLDPATAAAYILLEGENARKVETGDRLIVKADSSGPGINCKYVTVLEKEAKEEGFLTIPSTLDPNVDVNVPSGVYMKVNPNALSLIVDELSYINYGTKSATSKKNNRGPFVNYPLGRYDSTLGKWIDYDIPAGSRIIFDFEFDRRGASSGTGNCEKRYYKLTKTLVSTSNYNNFKDWFDGDNIDQILNDGFEEVGGTGCSIGNTYNPVLFTGAIGGITGTTTLADLCNNKYQFVRDNTAPGNPYSELLALNISGTIACGVSKAGNSNLKVSISVFRADNTLIFETEPSDTLPDVFFENHVSFPIDTATGYHLSNGKDDEQDQTGAQPAILSTEFFNCYAFGNGAESYKVRDSVVGKTFNLGNRVTSVAAQDYKEADRFADLTYSGVYNDESNVNRLNAFNMGLLNFKALEDSFGPVMLIDGRETDILTLQEDKISYVLAGKNLLSDSAAGGAITSVPEVLGTQIARIEKFGISFNPESFAKWGSDKFFTDAKRGAVIQLKGDSYNNEQMRVVSDAGMRPWFRDMFIASLMTQKVGGYDPYMTEYVLSTNDTPVPVPDDCVECGFKRTVTIPDPELPLEFCVDLSVLIGDFDVDWSIVSLTPGDTINVSVTFDGVTTTSGDVTTGGTLTINKPGVSPTTATILVTTTGTASIKINVQCPVATPLTIIEVVLTDPIDVGLFIHAEYLWEDSPYVSPTTSNIVTFQPGPGLPLVSRYVSTAGFQGSGSFPLDGADVRIQSNKIGFDNFDFNPSLNGFRWLRSNTLYANTALDISALLAASTVASPNVGASPTYYADFVMPASADQYLYLIWDFRTPREVTLCFEKGNAFDACCGCDLCEELCRTYSIYNEADENANVGYTDCDTGTYIIAGVPLGTTVLCSSTIPVPYRDSDLVITESVCGCNIVT